MTAVILQLILSFTFVQIREFRQCCTNLERKSAAQASCQLGHNCRRLFLYFTESFISCRHDQVFQHLDIIWIYHFFCQLHLCHFFFTGNRNFYGSAACCSSKFLFLKGLLIFFHLPLHLLGLLH